MGGRRVCASGVPEVPYSSLSGPDKICTPRMAQTAEGFFFLVPTLVYTLESSEELENNVDFQEPPLETSNGTV